MAKHFHPMKTGTYRISSGYGPRWGTMHARIDFAAPIGTPIYACADGTVVQGKERPKGSVAGFGSWIWIDSQESCGKDFIYGHVQHEGIKVRAGEKVRAGQLIGVVGNEGQSTGPHLHFEVWGKPGRLGGHHQDPALWLQGKPSPGTNSQPAGKDMPVAGTIFGIDISEHQRNFPLSKAKAEGMEFVILRLCDGTHVDSLFKSHLADAERQGGVLQDMGVRDDLFCAHDRAAFSGDDAGA